MPGVTKPPGVSYSLSDRWMQVARALTQALGARLILGINLEADSTEIAGTEARNRTEHTGAVDIGAKPKQHASQHSQIVDCVSGRHLRQQMQ